MKRVFSHSYLLTYRSIGVRKDLCDHRLFQHRNQHNSCSVGHKNRQKVTDSNLPLADSFICIRFSFWKVSVLGEVFGFGRLKMQCLHAAGDLTKCPRRKSVCLCGT